MNKLKTTKCMLSKFPSLYILTKFLGNQTDSREKRDLQAFYSALASTSSQTVKKKIYFLHSFLVQTKANKH